MALLLWIYMSGCIIIFGACLCAVANSDISGTALHRREVPEPERTRREASRGLLDYYSLRHRAIGYRGRRASRARREPGAAEIDDARGRARARAFFVGRVLRRASR